MRKHGLENLPSSAGKSNYGWWWANIFWQHFFDMLQAGILQNDEITLSNIDIYNISRNACKGLLKSSLQKDFSCVYNV